MKKITDFFITTLDSCKDIQIFIVIDTDTGDKYFRLEDQIVYKPIPEIRVYKYPDVNPLIFKIMDIIEQKCGESRFHDDGFMKAPHLFNAYIYRYDATDIIGRFVNDDFVDEVLSADVPIPYQEYYDDKL